MKAYKRRINCAYRYGLKSNIKVIYIQPRIIVNIFESKYKSTLYIERTRINILVTDINVHMVTSKCHQMKKHPIYGAYLSVNFWNLKNDKPTAPNPFSRIQQAVFKYVDNCIRNIHHSFYSFYFCSNPQIYLLIQLSTLRPILVSIQKELSRNEYIIICIMKKNNFLRTSVLTYFNKPFIISLKIPYLAT